MTAVRLVDEAIAALIESGETAPRIISMDVDDGPRWAETDIIPVKPADLDGTICRYHWLVDVYIGHNRGAQGRFTIACQFDCGWHQCCGCA